MGGYDLALGDIPEGVTGWLSIANTNFDKVETYINAIMNMVCSDDDLVIHEDEIVIYVD